MRVLTAKKSAKSYLNIVHEIASLENENTRVLWFRQPVVHTILCGRKSLYLYHTVTMERFCRRPFRHIDEYATARVQGSSALAVELHATARPNGRAIDAFQLRVGGDLFEVEARLDDFIPLPRFKFQQRPANILIRPNMAASVWQCLVAALVMMREADVFDEEGAGIPAGMFVGILNEMEEDDEPDAAFFRWSVVIDDAMGVGLQLRALPASSTVLCGKPAMRK